MRGREKSARKFWNSLSPSDVGMLTCLTWCTDFRECQMRVMAHREKYKMICHHRLALTHSFFSFIVVSSVSFGGGVYGDERRCGVFILFGGSSLIWLVGISDEFPDKDICLFILEFLLLADNYVHISHIMRNLLKEYLTIRNTFELFSVLEDLCGKSYFCTAYHLLINRKKKKQILFSAGEQLSPKFAL